MDVFDSCESLLKGRGLGKGGQSGFHCIGGWRLTGSASNAMDVLVGCDSLFIGEGFREGKALMSEPDWRLADDGKRI